MPSGLRLQRIADSIRQEISEMLIREISDPRLKLISITDVKVDKELAESLASLYHQGKLTDTNVKNEIQKIRDKNANKN